MRQLMGQDLVGLTSRDREARHLVLGKLEPVTVDVEVTATGLVVPTVTPVVEGTRTNILVLLYLLEVVEARVSLPVEE